MFRKGPSRGPRGHPFRSVLRNQRRSLAFLSTGCRGHPCRRKRETHRGFHYNQVVLFPTAYRAFFCTTGFFAFGGRPRRRFSTPVASSSSSSGPNALSTCTSSSAVGTRSTCSSASSGLLSSSGPVHRPPNGLASPL